MDPSNGKLNVIAVDDELLRGWALPMPSDEGGKESRGRLLVIAGSAEMPGGALLAGNSALRAGAGKLTVATAASVAPLIALAIPEARVIGLQQTAGGAISAGAAESLDP